MVLRVKKVYNNAKLPTLGTADSAGYDVYACENVEIKPHSSEMVHTGIAVELDTRYENEYEGRKLNYGIFLYARSGLACKQGLAPANCVGVIDADYRGEVMICMYNHSNETRTIKTGDKVAQLVIAPIYKVNNIIEVDDLGYTDRGEGGFGSTGER